MKMKRESKTACSGGCCNRRSCESKPTRRTTATGRFGLKTILVPVDFSEQSKKALGYANAFAEEFGARIILLNVVPPLTRPADYATIPGVTEGRAFARMNQRERQLAEFRKAETGEAAHDENIVQMGKATDEIISLAEARKADLIVIGTHGYTGMERVLLGSTAEQVVRRAPCPVLVVRDKENDFVETNTNNVQKGKEKL